MSGAAPTGRAPRRRGRPPQRNPEGAGIFCVVGLSKGSSVVFTTAFTLLLPTPQNLSGADGSIWSDRAPHQRRAQRPIKAPMRAAAAMPVVYQMRMKGAVYSTQWMA